jgi:hypothetical protein
MEAGEGLIVVVVGEGGRRIAKHLKLQGSEQCVLEGQVCAFLLVEFLNLFGQIAHHREMPGALMQMTLCSPTVQMTLSFLHIRRLARRANGQMVNWSTVGGVHPAIGVLSGATGSWT